MRIQLPVSDETNVPRSVVLKFYGFDVEVWNIPSVNNHVEGQ
jgi:hypothetical protein